nr:hypothetical protein [Natronorubrum texcoconense]
MYSGGFGAGDAWFMTSLFDTDSSRAGIETVVAAYMLYERVIERVVERRSSSPRRTRR